MSLFLLCRLHIFLSFTALLFSKLNYLPKLFYVMYPSSPWPALILSSCNSHLQHTCPCSLRFSASCPHHSSLSSSISWHCLPECCYEYYGGYFCVHCFVFQSFTLIWSSFSFAVPFPVQTIAWILSSPSQYLPCHYFTKNLMLVYFCLPCSINVTLK